MSAPRGDCKITAPSPRPLSPHLSTSPSKNDLYRSTPPAMKTNCPGCQYDTKRRQERRIQRTIKGKNKKAAGRTFGDGQAGLGSEEEVDTMRYMIDAVWAAALSRVSKAPGQRVTLDEMGVDEEYIKSLAQNSNGPTPHLNNRGNVTTSKAQVSICRIFSLCRHCVVYAHTKDSKINGNRR